MTAGVKPEAGGPPAGEPQAGGAPAGSVLADLQAQADAVDGPAPGTEQPGATPAVVADPAAELLGALTMARMLVQPMFDWWPRFPEVWSDSTLTGISQAGAQVMARHGWTMGDLLGQWGPYIALAGATAPPCWVTWKAIQAQQAAQAAAAAAEKQGARDGGPGKAGN